MNLLDRQLRIEHFTGSEVQKPEPAWILLSDIEPQYKQLFYWGADNPKVESLSKPLSKYGGAWYLICNDGYEGLKWCDAKSYDKAISEYQYLQKGYEGWELLYQSKGKTVFKIGNLIELPGHIDDGCEFMGLYVMMEDDREKAIKKEDFGRFQIEFSARIKMTEVTKSGLRTLFDFESLSIRTFESILKDHGI